MKAKLTVITKKKIRKTKKDKEYFLEEFGMFKWKSELKDYDYNLSKIFSSNLPVLVS
jgi:hypothetical protein